MQFSAGRHLVSYHFVQWTVKLLSNKNYTIQSADFNLYANPENGSWTEGNGIIAGPRLRQWKIMPKNGSHWCVLDRFHLWMINNIFVFSIGLTWDPDVCWSLPDGEHHTPVG